MTKPLDVSATHFFHIVGECVLLFHAGTVRFVRDVFACSGLCIEHCRQRQVVAATSYAASDASGLPCRLPYVVRNLPNRKPEQPPNLRGEEIRSTE